VVKVLDFGLVKLRGQPGNTLDGNGLIAGTPGFMSPEAIIEPASVDARADIYALGAVGYFLVTGRHLFSGATDAAVLLDQVSTPPVPMSRRLGAAVPADLDGIILSCLAKEPRLRPQSADSLCQLLLNCHDAGGWSQAQAQSWWSAHRALVQRRVHDRRVSISEPVAVTGRDRNLA
jgi:serine/threonine-protein kinase